MKKGIALLSCIIMFFLLPINAYASTADAVEPVQLNQPCSLEITYQKNQVFTGIDVTIWQATVLTQELEYITHENFAAYSVDLSSLKTPSEFDSAANTLYTCAVADQIPGITVKTDDAGKARFENLSCGMYLVAPVNVDHTYFSAMLVAVPDVGSDGLWNYDVKAQPKSTTETPPSETEVEYQVTKLWKDRGNETQRPSSVESEIYKDGTLVETVILNEQNNWSYRWSALDDGSVWTVLERNVPQGYTMKLTQNEYSFLIENTKPGDPDIPQTGDDSNIMLYVALMIVSSFGIIVLLITRKKGRAT